MFCLYGGCATVKRGAELRQHLATIHYYDKFFFLKFLSADTSNEYALPTLYAVIRPALIHLLSVTADIP